tara:strand:- start:275 stop:1036 length:762 start_codon:yes stop_codon:yes gene_type:complete
MGAKRSGLIHGSISSIVIGAFFTLALSCGADKADLRVMAAASLSEAFLDISEAFENETGVKITLYTAGSSTLATQITEGALADVVGLANEETMERVKNSGRIATGTEIKIFATNHLVLVTPNGNPASITSFADLSDAVVAVCAPAVPCGSLSYTFSDMEKMSLEPASVEPNVRSVRTKVQLGEVDAGLIYITDITPELEVIDIPRLDSLQTNYPITALKPGKLAAQDFINFVLSSSGQSILAQYGFGAGHESE